MQRLLNQGPYTREPFYQHLHLAHKQKTFQKQVKKKKKKPSDFATSITDCLI